MNDMQRTPIAPRPAPSPFGQEAPAASAPLSAWYALFAFCVAAILSYTDRQILSLLVDPLRMAMRLSDTQVSLLQGVAFALIYAAAGLPLGRMADILPRRHVLVGGVLLWSVATICCGFAHSFAELFAARSVVGIGEAALAPAATAMIADYFSARQRGTATSLFLMGQVVGGGLAIALGGAILSLAGSRAFAALPLVGGLPAWRVTLMILGCPGIVVACLLMAIKEPPRRAPADAAKAAAGEAARLLMARRRRLVPLYGAMAMLSVGDFSLQNWFPTLLARQFGMTPGQIGADLGTAAIAGAMIGTVSAGLLSDRRAARGGAVSRLPIAIVAAGLAAPGAAILFAPAAGWAIGLFMLWIVMSNAAGAIGITAVQELAPDAARGVALALISVFNMSVGLSFGTTATAMLADHVYLGPSGLAASITTVALPAALMGMGLFRLAARACTVADGRIMSDASPASASPARCS
ncbi:MFS transporter [Nguyenibacter sp. L1]|uniref:MFS transporter n=1 Tax=Nguyenibacter sp. L1 TaxID=3049350 RepID=UPI002B49EBC6|nr:MFS transporter [Nguyenibacter sp. L1]WRH86686.1 MFS transporter [Nguyenibacter sp. L1]